MKKFKKVLILFILCVSVFVGVNVGKVSAYKCVYTGAKMETTNWLSKAEGELAININSATSVKADFSKFESKDNEWATNLMLLFANGSGALVTTLNSSLIDKPLDAISRTKNISGQQYSMAYLTGYSKQMEDAFNKKRCPSTVNITYLTCSGHYASTGYNFNPDIWDWFSSSSGKYTFFLNTGEACTYEDKDGTNTAVWQLDENKSDKKSTNLMFACKKLGNFVDEGKTSLKTLYNNYQDCVSKNKDNKIKCRKLKASYENKLWVVRNWCKSVLNNRYYNSSCLQGCVDLNKKVYDIKCVRGSGKNKKDICTNNGGNCNLSGEIIAFVYNILKWMKYIAPVLVIILGILDFIKALASQDDDAMKKAQGKFIKRLVAATVLFLLPLIIDYILNVFDLYDSSCDVTELFK